MTLVSIGVPVFNGEDFLAEALDSILDQDVDDIEIIISDNASTDRTQQICEAYQARDARIRYDRLPHNLGAAANYNRAFEMAEGTYFKWAAHDDLIAPTFLSSCIAAFERAPETTALVHPPAEFIDEHGEPLRVHGDRAHTTARHPAVRALQIVTQLNLIASVFGLFRRDALMRTRRIGSFVASDYVLLVECALLGDIVYLDGAPLFQRRVHDKMSRRANVSDADALRWFDPQMSSRLTARQRLYIEYVRSAMTVGDLKPTQRAASAALLVGGVAYRRGRVRLGRWRRDLAVVVSSAKKR